MGGARAWPSLRGRLCGVWASFKGGVGDGGGRAPARLGGGRGTPGRRPSLKAATQATPLNSNTNQHTPEKPRPNTTTPQNKHEAARPQNQSPQKTIGRAPPTSPQNNQNPPKTPGRSQPPPPFKTPSKSSRSVPSHRTPFPPQKERKLSMLTNPVCPPPTACTRRSGSLTVGRRWWSRSWGGGTSRPRPSAYWFWGWFGGGVGGLSRVGLGMVWEWGGGRDFSTLSLSLFRGGRFGV